MEEDVSGETSFSNIDLDAPQSAFGNFLDLACPYFISYGMTYDEFWNESIERLESYWQANQYSVERRNQELWIQGMYIREAVASCFDKRNKYPSKPYRLTEMTESEKEAENKRKVEELREVLMAHKRKFRGVEIDDRRES